MPSYENVPEARESDPRFCGPPRRIAGCRKKLARRWNDRVWSEAKGVSKTIMVIKFAIAVSIASGALAGCAVQEHPPPQPEASLALATFAGVLPCADCTGIRTELRLYTEQPSGKPERYELTQTYLGTRVGDPTVGTVGRWTVLGASASDPSPAVYQLDFDRPDRRRNFLKVGDEELRLLDQSQDEISTSLPHSLYRVSKESTISMVTLAESDAGRVIDVDPEQLIIIRLTSNRTTGYSWTLAPPNPAGLTRLGEPTYAHDRMPGADGLETWSFRASRQGREELHFEYRRPWEREAAAATLSYTFNVR